MFRARHVDPFAGLYDDAWRQRDEARRGSFLTQVVHSDGGSLLDVASRVERSSSVGSSIGTRRGGELASPFRFRSHVKRAEQRKLKKYPTVSATSTYARLHPSELGFKTIGANTKRAKDIRFPVYLSNNEAKQEQQLFKLRARERNLDYIKNSQIVYDYTEEGQKKKNAKKKNGKEKSSANGNRAVKKKPNAKKNSSVKATPGAKSKAKTKTKAKTKSKNNDDLETIHAEDIGSEYTFETLPEGADYDYLIEVEDVPAGATHGKLTQKPVKLVKKGQKGTKKRLSTPIASTPEIASETTPESAPVTGARYQDTSGDTYEQLGISRESREEGDVTEDSIPKTTRFKEGPVEHIPDADYSTGTAASDVVVMAPEEGIHREGGSDVVVVAVEDEIIEEPVETNSQQEEEEEEEGEEEERETEETTPEYDEEHDSSPGSMISDVNSEASSISPPADYTTMPRVTAFPEADTKKKAFTLGPRRKQKTAHPTNPLATPENPELLVKTDREGFLSKGVYDRVNYENHQHSKWLAEFVQAEKQRCEDKQVDYNNKLSDLKKEVKKLEESMQEVEEDANELMEIRDCRLSRKLIEETQKYVEKKNQIFHETKYIQDQKDRQTEAIREKQREVQKEIDALNDEKDTVHREFIGWTNRLSDLSAHLDAEMRNLVQLEQARVQTRTQLSELSQRKAALEEEMIGYNSTHFKNRKQLESHANKEYLPQIHEIDFKISNLLNELSIVKQGTADEKVKVANITKKLDDERQAHEEKLKLEAEKREREERNLLGKQREEHEAAAAELKLQHQRELEKMKEDYEKQLQDLRERQATQAAEAEAARRRAAEAEAAREEAAKTAALKAEDSRAAAAKAKETEAMIANAEAKNVEGTEATATKEEATNAGVGKVDVPQEKATETEAAKAAESTIGDVSVPGNPFADPVKQGGVAPHEARQSIGSYAASYCTANDNKQHPRDSRASSLFDYETEEEVRSINS